MFDFSGAEIILIGIVSMIFIGPKDFPKVVRWGTDALKKCRAMAREFHSQVDEMVKDTDLKEAKDQLMQLRRMNVKSVILDAIDKDGKLQETLNSPLTQTVPYSTHSGTSFSHSVKSVEYSERVTETEFMPQYTIPVDSDHDKEVDWVKLKQDDPAPSFLPPAIAQRLQLKRAAPPVPAMIPPQIATYKEERWS